MAELIRFEIKQLNIIREECSVERVAEGSIAWRRGIHPGTLRAKVEGADLVLGGDVILGVNEIQITENISSHDAIYKSIGAVKPGSSLVIKVFPQGQIVKLTLPIEP